MKYSNIADSHQDKSLHPPSRSMSEESLFPYGRGCNAMQVVKKYFSPNFIVIYVDMAEIFEENKRKGWIFNTGPYGDPPPLKMTNLKDSCFISINME